MSVPGKQNSGLQGIGGIPSSNSPGIFSFGGASQFGGLSSGVLLFGTAGLGGAAENDPYANIQIDTTNLKKAAPQPKPYEQKSEEEKKQASSSTAGKSNLKKDFEQPKKKESDKEEKSKDRKRSVTFGDATKIEFDREDESGEYNNKDLHDGGKGSPRPQKVVEVKDLSDGRNEKEKIKEMLEKKQREELEEIKRMEKWSEEQRRSSPSKTNTVKDNDSDLADSSSKETFKSVKQLQSKQTAKQEDDESEQSYSDTFEASGSGSKYSHPAKKEEQSDAIYDPSLMDAYMKKLQQNIPNVQKKPPVPATFDASESSDRQEYEDDFESISKSQSGIMNSMLPTPTVSNKVTPNQGKEQPKVSQKQQVYEYKDSYVEQPHPKTILEKYVKKEN